MLIINNLKFAKNDSEFVNTLFAASSTSYGYYKKLNGRIHLMNHKKEIFAAIVVQDRYQGIVNAVRIEPKNKVFYQYGLCSKIKELLGVPEKYSEQGAYAESVFNSVA